MGDNITSLELARYLKIKEQTLRKMRISGFGPKYIRLGGVRGRVLYRVRDVEDWLKDRTFKSTAEEMEEVKKNEKERRA